MGGDRVFRLKFSLFIVCQYLDYGGSDTFYGIKKPRPSAELRSLKVGAFMPISHKTYGKIYLKTEKLNFRF